MNEFGWCSNCREKSIIVKFNKSKTKRWQICLNKGCNFKQETTYHYSVWGLTNDFRRHNVKKLQEY
jgi:predicted transcriptional regulator